MKLVPIGRRSFLSGHFLARHSGSAFDDTLQRSAAESGPASDDPNTPVVLGFAPRFESERAPFDRRRDVRATLAHRPMLARVDRFACLASSTSVCRACVEHCPVDGAVTFRDGVPQVDPDRCDGCGRCEVACPAPGGAIRALPALPMVPHANARGT